MLKSIKEKAGLKKVYQLLKDKFEEWEGTWIYQDFFSNENEGYKHYLHNVSNDRELKVDFINGDFEEIADQIASKLTRNATFWMLAQGGRY